MFLEKLFPKNFISFYEMHHKFYSLSQTIKNNKIVIEEKKEFDTKTELIKYINEKTEEIPQTYTSTIIFSIDQGVIDSCSKKRFQELEIKIENIKYVCIKNRYSFYTSIYDFSEIKKNLEFLDFIYPIFAIIDFKAKKRDNTLYMLNIDKYFAILIYKNEIPIFSEIFNDEEEIEDISDMEIDNFDDFDDDLDDLDDIEDIDEIEEIEDIDSVSEEIEENNISHLEEESKILNHLKESIKHYYDTGGDFLENIVIFTNQDINSNSATLIEDEFFIPTKMEKIDILKILNEISIENV